MEYKKIKRKLSKAPKYSTVTGKQPDVCRPVRLTHNDAEVFNVHVLTLLSVNEVSFRRIAIDLRIDDLWFTTWNDMITFYEENVAQLTPVKSLEKDRLYAVKSNETWSRAVFSGVYEADDPILEIVDVGNFVAVSPSAIFPLENRFGVFPCQATHCVLYGLQYLTFVSCKAAKNAVKEHLLGKILVASIIERKPQLSIIFFKHPGLNLNELILLKVAKSVQLIPLKDGEPAEEEDISTKDPCISYRTKTSVMDGLIFIAGLKCSQRLPASDVTVDGLYLGYNAKEGWSRMKLQSNVPLREKFRVNMIDYGNRVETVRKYKLWDLNSMSPELAQISEHKCAVLPLSCWCARVISKNEIDVKSAPLSLQSFVRLHRYPF